MCAGAREKARAANLSQIHSRARWEWNRPSKGFALPQRSLSVVVPLLNEQESIPELYARLNHEIERLTGIDPYSCEFIFIDDGSADDTFRLLRELATNGEIKGDTTTLEDFGVIAKLREQDE